LGINSLEQIEVQLSSSRPPPHIIIHARKCHLQGLSPRQNRNIPPLDYNRVWHTAQKYPQAIFSINGGFRTTEAVIEAISKIDGCMIGREGTCVYYLKSGIRFDDTDHIL
jgi:tRNA-dihydrouridine synthase A